MTDGTTKIPTRLLTDRYAKWRCDVLKNNNLLIGVFEFYATHITYLLEKRHEQF